VDDLPVAVDDLATVTEDDPATLIDVLANDTDVDGGPINVDSVSDPAGGTVVNAGTHVTYQPDPDFCNDGSPTDDFTYTLNGGSTATVFVTVTCVDDLPVAVDDLATVTEDDPAGPGLLQRRQPDRRFHIHAERRILRNGVRDGDLRSRTSRGDPTRAF
jgi:VCBS repeat-containing protein